MRVDHTNMCMTARTIAEDGKTTVLLHARHYYGDWVEHPIHQLPACPRTLDGVHLNSGGYYVKT